ncbi:helix-turn-helix transcriptional regulator [Paenibacillus arenilitoris]|uniref:AraC family transcriptional regulator n=1 Tax=Paenibacillus arenilitoris TaxID=2772299 RepID=A0A927CJD4_9BACL|nr:AraC family transcriptional regulator [Paenibacillus arenilitoris]MBD2868545.1 AraC family transcriptional regulator [Paenibacillus arenilitoris]
MNYNIIDSRNCGKAKCEIGWNWHPGPMPDYDLWCALQGSGVMNINGRSYPIRRGACFLVHPGDVPLAEQHPEDRLTVIYIHFKLQPRPGNAGETTDNRIAELFPERVVYFNEIYELERLLNQLLGATVHPDDWKDMEFDSLIKLLLIMMHRERKQQLAASGLSLSMKQRQAVKLVMQRIREDGWQGRPYEELADMVGLTPGYLAKLFKQYAGLSMKEYMTKVRLERAKHLLVETSMNVSQVSEALGYSSVFLFSKQFKKYFGLPPSSLQHSRMEAKPH